MVSTTSQILASFLLLLSLAFVLLIKNLNEDVEQEYNQAMEEPMVDTANLFASLIEARMAAGETDLTSFARAIELAGQREVEAQIYEFKKRGIDMNVYVTDEKGMVLFDSDGGLLNGQDLSQSNDVLRTLKGQYGARSTRKDEADDRSSVLYVGAPIHHDGKLAGVVSVSKPQASMFFFVRETRRRIYNIVLLTFAALALAGLLLSRWFSRPLRRLTEYSRAVVRGERQSPPRLQTREGKTLAGA
ncbi:MAG: two-component system sensor histidine kinase CreC, partial [Verrucomicrobiota bacterium]